MVDERGAAVGGESPVAAPGAADDVAEVPEAEAEAIASTEKSLRGRAASPSPSAGSSVLGHNLLLHRMRSLAPHGKGRRRQSSMSSSRIRRPYP